MMTSKKFMIFALILLLLGGAVGRLPDSNLLVNSVLLGIILLGSWIVYYLIDKR